jgi:hypothetical protein
MNPLQKFYIDTDMFNSVKELMVKHLESLAIKRAFDGTETTGIKEANKIIRDAFDQIEREYSPNKKTENISQSE